MSFVRERGFLRLKHRDTGRIGKEKIPSSHSTSVSDYQLCPGRLWGLKSALVASVYDFLRHQALHGGSEYPFGLCVQWRQVSFRQRKCKVHEFGREEWHPVLNAVVHRVAIGIPQEAWYAIEGQLVSKLLD